MTNPKVNIPIASAFFGLFGVILGGFLTIIFWPFVKSALEYIWDKFTTKISRKNFENRYLDWLIEDHRYIPMLPTTLVPVTDSKIHELDQLYVSLSVRNDKGKSNSISLSESLNNNHSIMILGDPGSGKTTMLRFLTLTFARARRKRFIFMISNKRNVDKLKYKEAKRKVSKEFGYNGCPLPIFVDLNQLRGITEWSSGYSLLDSLRSKLKSVDILRDFPKDFFFKKLKHGECVFLFDAFDELGTQEDRNAAAKLIGELATSSPKGNRFIVTSRIVGYNGQLSCYGFHIFNIKPLSWNSVNKLVKKWYESLNENALAEQLLNTLKANPRIYELAINPMLLSLIVLVQYTRRLIPDKRHILYDECVNILIERRYAHPNVQDEYNSVLPADEAVRLLQGLALAFHKARIREISRIDLEKKYIPNVSNSMFNSKAVTLSAIEILENIEKRSQLLVERGFNNEAEPVMAFSHLTFQEYLVSIALKELTGKRGETVVSSQLINYYENDPEWWKEVTLLYTAQLDGESKKSFLDRLYPAQEMNR